MNRVVPLLLLFALAAPYTANAASDAAASARFLAPFLDEQTIAVVQVDLTRCKPAAAFDRWVEIIPEAARMADGRREFWESLHATLTKVGLVEAYAVVSLADVPVRPPLFVAPKGEGASSEGLVAALQGLVKDWPDLEVVDRDGAVVVASREALDRLYAGVFAARRPELEPALAAAGDHAVRVVMLPTDDDRRVVEELMPELPEALGRLPVTTVTRGVRWLAMGVDVEMPALSVVGQSADGAAAHAFMDGWRRSLDSLAAAEGESLPNLAKALQVIQPNVAEDRLVVELNAARTRSALLAAQGPVREVQLIDWRYKNSLRLKQLALGVLNHDSARKVLPTAYSVDADGKPLLSWRVHILPFMEEVELWRQFHLDEPWDSPHNKALIPKMPELFRSPASRHRASDGLSTYSAVVGPRTAFPGDKGITLQQIRDGLSNTILFVDVDDEHAEIWTKPGGLPFDGKELPAGLGGQFPEGIHAVFCDGHSKLLTNPPVDDAMLRALFTIDGGEPIKW